MMILAVMLSISAVALAQNTRQTSLLVNQTFTDNGVVLSWKSPANARPSQLEFRSIDGTVIRTEEVAPDETGLTTYLVPDAAEFVEIEILQLYRVNNVDVLGTSYIALNRGETASITNPKDAIIIVDSDMYAGIESNLLRYVDDLTREGWHVSVHQVAPQEFPEDLDGIDVIKQTIRQEIDTRYPEEFPERAHVLLIGALPYAYSGGYNVATGTPNPDFHTEHGGAWASDSYYGDLQHNGISADRLWTDNKVSIVDPAVVRREENVNTLGDGKFDQHVIPTDLDVCIGRLDFRRLRRFGVTEESRDREIELTNQYFDRNHAYRTRAFVPPYRAIVDDNFGTFTRVFEGNARVTEAFATSGYRSFAPIVSSDSIVLGDWIADTSNTRPTLDTFPALFAYGCGGGGYAHCTGVARTEEFVDNPLHATFTMLFGSYFGDVDSDNNILRAQLAADGNVLATVWSGRPHWFLHRMAAGGTIGESHRLSANNATDYIGATVVDTVTKTYQAFTLGARNVHMMLIGDPTLQLQGPTIEGELTASQIGSTIELEWARSPEHGEAPSQNVAYVVESGAPGEAMSVRDTIAPSNETALSATIDIPSGHGVVRVRPYFTATGRASILSGRGVVTPVMVSSVEERDPSYVYTNVVIADLQGRIIGRYTGTRAEIRNQMVRNGLPQGLYVAGLDSEQGWTISIVR